MNTKDLDSYYSGYEAYEESRNAKVPFEDYRDLEDKITIYKALVEETKSTFEEEISDKEKIKKLKNLVEDLEENLDNA